MFVQDTDRELIKVNRDIHESKRVKVVFNILHLFCNCSITLPRTGKIMAMDHDPFMGGRGVCLLDGGPCTLRCGRGGEKLHEHGRDGYDNCIKKKLILSELESIIHI